MRNAVPDTQNLYRPRLAVSLLGLLASAFAALPKQSADTQYLEGLRESELEDLGLRRAPERDYRPFV